MTNTSGCYYSL